MPKIHPIFALAAIALPAPAAAQARIASALPARILAAHNAERAVLGLPLLVWDNNLGRAAAVWASEIAATGRFEHSDRRSRPGIGENLWYGTRGAYSVEAMVGAWASEKRNFFAGIFPRVSRTGNWEDVVHYSQMIWPSTSRVGCALASNRTTDYLVCRYSPKGNRDGRRVP